MEASRGEEKQQTELHRPPALGPHPLLVYFQGEHGQSQTHIREMQDMQIATCSHAWDITWTKHDLEPPIAEEVGVADTLECVVDGEDSSLRGGPCAHLKLDLEKKTWIRLRRNKNHAFFIGPFGQIVSYSVKTREFKETKSILLHQKFRVLYEYDISMESVRASLPCSNVEVYCRPQSILPPVKDK
ncbi:hypothetical protein SADUNF_Sadunf05G0018500 [Salix dunnii]|uniref:Uncharacterized protein n=1 Tax=Salix dunnii TaxID=1413687 RepID=A0A835K6C1_9ROSI|nr:hypothetical protein SADUNF_Sadunf05G0018500 [Salix dunnii]